MSYDSERHPREDHVSTYEELKSEIEKLGRFESLVHFPEKRDKDWPKWAARASWNEKQTPSGICGYGETDIEAMRNLLNELKILTTK